MLAVEKPLHIHPAALPYSGDPGCQFAGGFRRHLELHLPLLSCLGLFRSMGQRKFNYRQAGGGVTVQTGPLAGLDRHLVAEVFVALWRREGWPQRDMTARHYTTLAAMSGGDAGTADVIELPGRVRACRGNGMLSIEPAGRSSEP